MKRYYKRWMIFAPLGLVLTGFGLCLVADAALLKYAGGETWNWVMYGTLALIVFNSGLSFFGQAVIERIRYLSTAKKEKDQA
jgi:hypothetical protein